MDVIINEMIKSVTLSEQPVGYRKDIATDKGLFEVEVVVKKKHNNIMTCLPVVAEPNYGGEGLSASEFVGGLGMML